MATKKQLMADVRILRDALRNEQESSQRLRDEYTLHSRFTSVNERIDQLEKIVQDLINAKA